MNRQTLAEATSLHDGPVPIYLMEEIAGAHPPHLPPWRGSNAAD